MNHRDYLEKISFLRKKMEKIDQRIVKWISLRVHISRKIGSLKNLHSVEVEDLAREEKVLQRINLLAEKWGMDNNLIHRIFRELIEESKFVQLYSNYPEKYAIPILSPFNREVEIPPSKSITNRALILSALADGVSVIRNPLVCEDSQYMVEALKDLGIKIQERSDSLIISGQKGIFSVPRNRIYTGGAGTAMRFLTALGSLVPGGMILEGNERMHERPIQNLLCALESQGLKAFSLYDNGCPPVFVFGKLKGGEVNLQANFSSQYLSALLMVSPYAQKELKINIQGDMVSGSYVKMTLDMMKKFGVEVQENREREYLIAEGQKYICQDYSVEKDFASASYFLGIAAILKSTLHLKGMKKNSIQGEMGFLGVLERMGARISWEGDTLIFSGDELRGIDVDMNEMPDSVMTLAVLGAYARGITRITNVSNLRIKESDRIHALFQELTRAGIRVEQLPDGLIVHGGEPKPCEMETYNDHRIAMSLSLLGIKKPGFILKNPACVTKTFPEYFQILECLAIQ